VDEIEALAVLVRWAGRGGIPPEELGRCLGVLLAALGVKLRAPQDVVKVLEEGRTPPSPRPQRGGGGKGQPRRYEGRISRPERLRAMPCLGER